MYDQACICTCATVVGVCVCAHVFLWGVCAKLVSQRNMLNHELSRLCRECSAEKSAKGWAEFIFWDSYSTALSGFSAVPGCTIREEAPWVWSGRTCLQTGNYYDAVRKPIWTKCDKSVFATDHVERWHHGVRNHIICMFDECVNLHQSAPVTGNPRLSTSRQLAHEATWTMAGQPWQAIHIWNQLVEPLSQSNPCESDLQKKANRSSAAQSSANLHYQMYQIMSVGYYQFVNWTD